MAAKSDQNPSQNGTNPKMMLDPETRRKVNEAAGSVVGAIEDVGNAVTSKGQGYLDRVIPAEKRDAFVSRVQAFASARPILSAFIGVNLLVTGVPVALFSLFSVSVFLFSLVTCVFLALLATITFTVFVVGAATLILLPTIFVTTITAGFLFFWGLSTYYLLRWATSKSGSPTLKDNESLRDSVNRITGGKVDEMDQKLSQNSDNKSADQYGDRFAKVWTSSETKGNASRRDPSEKVAPPLGMRIGETNSLKSESVIPSQGITDRDVHGAVVVTS